MPCWPKPPASWPSISKPLPPPHIRVTTPIAHRRERRERRRRAPARHHRSLARTGKRFWESDAGDEYEGEADAESLSSVFTNPRQRNVERVAAEAVEDADWQQHAGEVSDAHVLNEHSSTSTRS